MGCEVFALLGDSVLPVPSKEVKKEALFSKKVHLIFGKKVLFFKFYHN